MNISIGKSYNKPVKRETFKDMSIIITDDGCDVSVGQQYLSEIHVMAEVVIAENLSTVKDAQNFINNL